MLELGLSRRGGRSLVRVFNPDPARDGFASPHTVIMVVTDDKPFLVDSLGMVCTQNGTRRAPARAPGPVRGPRPPRPAAGSVHLDDPPQGAKLESWQMIEIDREPDPARLAAIETSIRRSLEDVRTATGDWRRMRAKASDAAAALGGARSRSHGSEFREAKALLEWMEDNHFTFLGYREYRLRRGPRRDRLVPVPRSSLGIMRSRAGRKPKTIALSGEVRDLRAFRGAAHHHQGQFGLHGPPRDLSRLCRRQDFRRERAMSAVNAGSSACGPPRPTARAPTRYRS